MRHNIGRQRRVQRNRSISESSTWERNPRRRQFSIGSVSHSSAGIQCDRKRSDSFGNDLNPKCVQNIPKSKCNILENNLSFI